jgi:glycosyltransferase involved in cell wall biosynthesis
VRTVSFVIPALNEQSNIPTVMAAIPRDALGRVGWQCEVIVVDNGSTDDTALLAVEHGARVVLQPMRGYGNAYMAGFAAASGSVIITGDADCTYPFDHAPTLLATLEATGLDFLSTNRLGRENRAAMKRSHVYANHALTLMNQMVLGAPFRDSQSGMWIFKREVWPTLDMRSIGMGFSQEIKNEAHRQGFRCGEVPIEYRTRGGQAKLNAIRDGLHNGAQVIRHRFRRVARQAPSSKAAVMPGNDNAPGTAGASGVPTSSVGNSEFKADSLAT